MSKISELRKQAGLTPDDLGRRMTPKLSQAQVYRIESKPENAKLSQLRQIADILGVPVNTLLAELDGLDIGSGLAIGRLHKTVPIFELSELGSRGQMLHAKAGNVLREYIAPTEDVPAGTFAVRIKGHANAGVLNEGDVAIVLPPGNVDPGQLVLVEHDRTGELMIGQWYPLHATSPDAPGFIVTPHNKQFDAMRCTKRDPGTILGRVREKRQIFS